MLFGNPIFIEITSKIWGMDSGSSEIVDMVWDS